MISKKISLLLQPLKIILPSQCNFVLSAVPPSRSFPHTSTQYVGNKEANAKRKIIKQVIDPSKRSFLEYCKPSQFDLA